MPIQSDYRLSFNIDAEPSIWIHAVSVGEPLTARPPIAALRERHPSLRIFLSTTTLSAQQLARRGGLDVDAVLYFPFDLAFVFRRTLDLVHPRLFLMMETELWPSSCVRVTGDAAAGAAKSKPGLVLAEVDAAPPLNRLVRPSRGGAQ